MSRGNQREKARENAAKKTAGQVRLSLSNSTSHQDRLTPTTGQEDHRMYSPTPHITITSLKFLDVRIRAGQSKRRRREDHARKAASGLAATPFHVHILLSNAQSVAEERKKGEAAAGGAAKKK
jgi:hypothetical protein